MGDEKVFQIHIQLQQSSQLVTCGHGSYSAYRNSVNNAFLRLFLYVQTNRTINIRI